MSSKLYGGIIGIACVIMSIVAYQLGLDPRDRIFVYP